MSVENSSAGIVLAAGSSRRMGRDKLFLDLGGETLLRRVAKVALAAGLRPVRVVLGPVAERGRTELQGLGVTTIENPEHARGIQTSLAAGVRSLPATCPAAVVLLGDMPFVTTEMVRGLVRSHRERRPPLVVSRYGLVTAPPTLFDRSLFPELGQGHRGRDVARRHRERALVVDWPAEDLADLDVEADYARALDRLGAGP
jgi:molybdenum cofactor cytidylyltransferase